MSFSVPSKAAVIVQTGAIALCASLIAAGAGNVLPFVQVAENWLGDLRVAYRGRELPASTGIVLILVDEDSLAKLPYRSPLDRKYLATLIQYLIDSRISGLGVDLLFDQATEPLKDDELQRVLRTVTAPLVLASGAQADGLKPAQVQFLMEFATGLEQGSATVIRDVVDNVVREVVLHRAGTGNETAGLAATLARQLGADMPPEPTLRLDFDGGENAFATFRAADIATLPAGWLRNKVVLIGVSTELGDAHRTPLSTLGAHNLPGAAIHAHALAQLLAGRSGPERSAGTAISTAVAMTLVGVLAALLSLPVTLGVLLASVILTLYWCGGVWLYQSEGMLIPLIAPSGGFVLAFMLITFSRWRCERASATFIKTAFATYLSEPLVEQLAAHPDRLRLGGERRTISMLFTDLAGYTTFSEQLEPEQLVTVMNEYLDGAIEIVFRHGGAVDKIVGDALHVLFNAPLNQPDHCERAVKCALELHRYCTRFAQQQAEQGVPFGLTRIGVNTGEVVVGNIGGRNRFDYSATGDPMNVAARLEGANKTLGTHICVSATTAAACPGMLFRRVGKLLLVGKGEPVEVHEPVQGSADTAALSDYDFAYSSMFTDPTTAANAFAALHARYPADPLSKFHLQRLRRGEDGDVIVLDSK